MLPDKKKLVTFSSLINSQSEILGALSARTAQLTILQQKIRAVFDPPLCEHLFVANFDNRILTLYTDSPAWAAKLRYNIPLITQTAQNKCGLAELRSVRIKVILPQNDILNTKRKNVLSDKTKILIRQTAEASNDPQIRSVLFRLCSD